MRSFLLRGPSSAGGSSNDTMTIQALADDYERRAKRASQRRKIALAALAKQARTASLKAELRAANRTR